ncbi:hypothetical protein BBAL3_3017 [Brevundimonas sp. BAL3]|uniref:hypothetical protein n=1 Tax=Brevundimonas sp. BAL3 TaxID=391600 RepID=UPI00017ED189|nr:hypothetical protein [Brevundimonas sp. BAL3]EDX81860.1 hypothetical protein BBAL3_3017 [Brevundimonas sp. BAL3]
MTNAVRTFDPIPDRHPRLLIWIQHYRADGVPLRRLADLFDITTAELVEAGVAP